MLSCCYLRLLPFLTPTVICCEWNLLILGEVSTDLCTVSMTKILAAQNRSIILNKNLSIALWSTTVFALAYLLIYLWVIRLHWWMIHLTFEYLLKHRLMNKINYPKGHISLCFEIYSMIPGNVNALRSVKFFCTLLQQIKGDTTMETISISLKIHSNSVRWRKLI